MKTKKRLIIAIDGPAGSGKSSTAQALAKALDLPYVDTGAMYRAVTLKALLKGVSLDDKNGLSGIARSSRIRFKAQKNGPQMVFLDGKNVTDRIRGPELTEKVRHIAKEPLVRRELVKKQQAMGLEQGAVMEGRDIGTVVFPRADFKFFFKAGSAVRAKRRHKDLMLSGKKMAMKKVLKDILSRDKSDMSRREGPLKKAKDAIVIDTSKLTISETVDKIIEFVNSSASKGRS